MKCWTHQFKRTNTDWFVSAFHRLCGFFSTAAPVNMPVKSWFQNVVMLCKISIKTKCNDLTISWTQILFTAELKSHFKWLDWKKRSFLNWWQQHVSIKLGPGHVYHSRQSGNWGDLLLDFWEKKGVPFLPDTKFKFKFSYNDRFSQSFDLISMFYFG